MFKTCQQQEVLSIFPTTNSYEYYLHSKAQSSTNLVIGIDLVISDVVVNKTVPRLFFTGGIGNIQRLQNRYAVRV